jgi:hypothetical protein
LYYLHLSQFEAMGQPHGIRRLHKGLRAKRAPGKQKDLALSLWLAALNFHTQASMNVLEFIIDWLPVTLQVWIFVLLARKRLYGRFPLFLLYTFVQIGTGLVLAASVGNKYYYYLYWWTAAIQALLSVLAIHEGFRAVFGTFYRLPWFRRLWPGTVALIWAYAAWRAWVHPPVHVTRANAMLVSVAIVASYTIVGLVLLFFLLVKVVRARWHLYEFNIVYGIGLTALGMMIAALVRSEFGTKFSWLAEWASPLAYFIAVLVWLSAFLRKEPQIKINTPPEVLLQGMQEDLSIVQRIFRKSAR